MVNLDDITVKKTFGDVEVTLEILEISDDYRAGAGLMGKLLCGKYEFSLTVHKPLKEGERIHDLLYVGEQQKVLVQGSNYFQRVGEKGYRRDGNEIVDRALVVDVFGLLGDLEDLVKFIESLSQYALPTKKEVERRKKGRHYTY